MAKRFITPFAEAGDRAAMPDTSTGSDSNYQTGYPAEYEEDPLVNPTTAKFVERDKSNQLYNDITANIKEWQEQTLPAFITSANNGGNAFPYKKDTKVVFSGKTYISIINNNTDTPPSANWVVFSENLTQSVNTVSDIPNANIVIGGRISWLGYYEPSDGGSNWGVIKSGAHTADGGSIFTIDANTYVEANLKGKRINVKKFGAKVDGVTDDLHPVQAAIDYAGIVKYSRATSNATRNEFSGCLVYIPWGECLISDTLNMFDAGVGLVGAGDESTTVKFTGANSLIRVQHFDGADFSIQKIRISDMYLRQMNVDPSSTNNAIKMTNVKHWRIKGVRFGGFFNDIILEGTQEPGFITDCDFFSGAAFTSSYTGGAHISIGNAEVSAAVGNEDPDNPGTYLLHSVMVFIHGCELRAGDESKAVGILVKGVDGLQITNCHILNSKDALIKFDIASATSPVANVKIDTVFMDGSEAQTTFGLIVEPPSYATAQLPGYPIDIELNGVKINGSGSGSGARCVALRSPYIARFKMNGGLVDKGLGDYFFEADSGGRLLAIEGVDFRSEDSFAPNAFILIGTADSAAESFDYVKIKGNTFYQGGVTSTIYNIRVTGPIGSIIISGNDYVPGSGVNGDGLVYDTSTAGTVKGSASTLNNTEF